ncbi:MAG: alginate export family protein, partial [Bacteroidia bacterium]|nr:alginate export family protein [Bacteroidia bacterium]
MRIKKIKALLITLFLAGTSLIQAQTIIGISELLIQKKIISQREADSLTTIAAFNEKVKTQGKLFSVGLEFRPRIEYRNGYKQLRNDTTQPAYFGTQRSRLYVTYATPKFKFHTSIQDIRVWGQYGQTSTSGSLSIFEAYAETYFTDNLFIRMGRQKVELDNGRLFSAANWSQAGRAHDGLNLIYKKEKISSELMCYFNQTSERLYETNFSPTTFANYKLLNTHYLDFKLNNYFTLKTINSADGYESKTNSRILYIRGTSGGRIEYEKGKIYATISGYYQYGRLQTRQQIAAYYLQ